jgi:5-methyltetrahydrofolate--homocysteine methyltransferase
MMQEGAGLEVINLGVDVKPEALVEAVRQHKPDIVRMGVLLTTTMADFRTTIQALEAAGVRRQVKIMIGGAPVTDAVAEKVGADVTPWTPAKP